MKASSTSDKDVKVAFTTEDWWKVCLRQRWNQMIKLSTTNIGLSEIIILIGLSKEVHSLYYQVFLPLYLT